MRYIVVLLVLIFTVTGCMPEDSAVAPFDRGDIVIGTAPMGSDYGTEVYYNLATQSIVKTSPINLWQIAVSGAGAPRLIVNSGISVAVSALPATAFGIPLSVNSLTWAYDAPSGSLDTTAFGNWYSGNGPAYLPSDSLYVVHLGYDSKGRVVGYRVVRFVSATDAAVELEVFTTQWQSQGRVTVQRDSQFVFTGIQIMGELKAVEYQPPSEQWDFVLTRYMHLFFEPDFLPYSVNGGIVNHRRVAAALDTKVKFSEATIADAEQAKYSPNWDAVGFGWKVFVIDKGLYIVNPNFVFFLKDDKGFYYKLHFTDFYDNKGEKGSPEFEYKRL